MNSSNDELCWCLTWRWAPRQWLSVWSSTTRIRSRWRSAGTEHSYTEKQSHQRLNPRQRRKWTIKWVPAALCLHVPGWFNGLQTRGASKFFFSFRVHRNSNHGKKTRRAGSGKGHVTGNKKTARAGWHNRYRPLKMWVLGDLICMRLQKRIVYRKLHLQFSNVHVQLWPTWNNKKTGLQ